MSERGQNALKLLTALVLESGRRWGDVAEPFQWADAEAVLDPEPGAATMHFLTRSRGSSKTSDLAGIAVAAMLFELPPSARCFAVSADKDQSRILVDAVSGFIARTPALARVLTTERYVVRTSAGASLECMSADAPSLYGIRPSLMICDELAQWPSGAQAVWVAALSGMAKVPGAKLVCLTSAGEPSHFSYKVRERAATSPAWRLHEVPGPAPWTSPAALAEQKALLTTSQYARLFDNVWTSSEDRLTTTADVAACVGHSGPLAPVPGRAYVLGLDIGLVSDKTVLTVAHLERRALGAVVVCDRQFTWQGTKAAPVNLGAVEETVREAARQYHAPLHADPWQAAAMCQRLRATGIKVHEFVFSSASVGRLALTMYRLLRDHLFDLDSEHRGLLDELATVRLIESNPGQYRLNHDADAHDDMTISLALCAQALVERGQPVRATISSPARLQMPAVPITRSTGGEARMIDRSAGRSGAARVLTPRDLRHLPGPHRR